MSANNPNKVYDVVVVGAGVIGSATAYRLSKKNPSLSVLLLERFDFLHRKGSSHGDSRIIRMTYPQAHYTELMTPAYKLWSEIEGESRQALYTRTGGLDFGRRENQELQQVLSIARQYGVETEVLTPPELGKRFPLVTLPEGWIALYSPSSGILNATKAVAVLQGLAKQNGCELLDNSEVVKVEKDSSCFKLMTSKGVVIRSRKVVLTLGTWALKILEREVGLSLPLTVEQTTIAYWRVEKDKAEKYHSSNFPVFINYEEPLLYGTPAHEFSGLLKCSAHFGNEVVDPDERDYEPGTDGLEKVVSPFLKQCFQGVEAEKPVRTETCAYTWTPDYDFIIDQVPDHPGLYIGCGFSGHGFKLAPVVGDILTEMVTEKRPTPTYSRALKHFAIKRFPSSLSKSKL